MSLGTYPEVTLREARALRDEARTLLAQGINPLVQRRNKREADRLAEEIPSKAPTISGWRIVRSPSRKVVKAPSLKFAASLTRM